MARERERERESLVLNVRAPAGRLGGEQGMSAGPGTRGEGRRPADFVCVRARARAYSCVPFVGVCARARRLWALPVVMVGRWRAGKTA